MSALLSALAGACVWAGGMVPFNAARFAALQAEDRTAVLYFFSANCGVCPQQEEALKRIAAEPGPLTPTVFQITFVPADEVCRRYEVTAPSTLIIFRGKSVIGRSAGLFTEDEIRQFIEGARFRSRARPKPRPKRTYRPKR
ncbi:MAG: thioredoxin family protein [Elusimicrobiota bacterium]